MRRILAGIIFLICAFFAYCADTGNFSTPRSITWTVFYGAGAVLMLAVFLNNGRPVVRIGVNTAKLKKKVNPRGRKSR